MTEYDPHRDGVWQTTLQLLERGHTVAQEVGLPGGRIDVAVIRRERIIWLLEIKARAHQTGIPQLLRYAESVEGKPWLTLVLDPDAATDEIRAQALEHGIGLWTFPLVYTAEDHQRYRARNYRGRMIHLPYLHPESVARMAARWRAEKAAA